MQLHIRIKKLIMLSLCLSLFLAAKTAVAIEAAEFSCKQRKVDSNKTQLICKLKNNWQYSIISLSIGEDKNGEYGSLHGREPYAVVAPLTWVGQWAMEEDTDLYAIQWATTDLKYPGVLPNDSLCCFKITVKASEVNLYRNAPVIVENLPGIRIITRAILDH